MTRSDSAMETVERRASKGPRLQRHLSAALHVVHPAALGCRVQLGRERLVIGRRPSGGEGDAAGEIGLKLDHPTVSRRHFAIEYDTTLRGHRARDLESRNGSRVDGAFVEPGEPCALADGAVLRIGDALAVYECGADVDAPDAPAVDQGTLPGDSAAMRRLRAAVNELARDPAPVLLLGETGTGKEFVAREVHRLSGRKGQLLAVNCAALSRELVESQLFGHARGAFTGANAPSTGLFRAAEGGSLLLDEIGELPLDLQPKLLRALEQSEVQPVGDSRPVKVDVRVIAATLRPLAELAHAGRFRLDLYARLALWEVAVPPLRKRRSDILAWVARLYRRFHAERGNAATRPLELDADVCERLLLSPWPDNLRGVTRFVHRVAQLGNTELDVSHLDEWLGPSAASGANAGIGGDAPTHATTTGAKRGKEARSAAAAAHVGADSDVGSDAHAGERERASGGGLDSGARPSREELERVFAEHAGSVRATAKHFGRDRRQIYRWLELYGLRALKS